MKMRCCWTVLAGAVLLVSSLSASNAQAAITIRAEHDENTTSITHQLLTELAAEVAQETNGRVKIDVHPSCSLSGGKIPVMIQNLQQGNEELAFIASGTYVNIDPRIGVWSLPFMVGGIDDLERLSRKSTLAKGLYGQQESRNLKIVDSWSRALRQLVNNRREIRTPEDMRGLKFRVSEVKMWVDTFKAVGATPIMMPFSEVPTALQLGTVEGADRPSEFLLSEKWWEMAKYVTMSNYTGDVILVAFNLKFWNGLDAETQKLLTAKLQAYGDKKLAQEKATEQKVIGILKDRGVKVTMLTPEQLAMFQAATKPVWDEYSGKIGKDLIDQAQKVVAAR